MVLATWRLCARQCTLQITISFGSCQTGSLTCESGSGLTSLVHMFPLMHDTTMAGRYLTAAGVLKAASGARWPGDCACWVQPSVRAMHAHSVDLGLP